jgi:hypothetical protein
VVTLAVLLTGEGSAVLELLLAVLLTSLPELGATKLTVLTTTAPLAKLGMAGKVTMPVVGLYVPSLDRNVKSRTMLSLIVTLVATLGPMFSVEIV